jgi:hypothetical protein
MMECKICGMQTANVAEHNRQFTGALVARQGIKQSPPVLDEFTQAYVECALWTCMTPDDRAPLSRDYDVSDIDRATLDAMIADCERFQLAHAEKLQAAYDSDVRLTWDGQQQPYGPAFAGHDLWLTRNRHGAGFWCRGLGELGEDLRQAAHACGERDLFLDDDNIIRSV